MSEPIRTCIGCGAKRPKAALVRLVAVEGKAKVDVAGHSAGRGAYVCGGACAKKALARKSLGRALRGPASADPSLVEQVEQR